MKYKLGMQTVEAVYDNNGTKTRSLRRCRSAWGRSSLHSKSGAVRRRPKRART